VPSRTFLCVSVDCECDKGPGWKTRRPLSFQGVHLGIGERLQPTFQRLGAKPTYLLSPELLRDARCLERLSSLEDCELGTHLHGELAEPGACEPEVTREAQRDYPEPVEREKLAWLSATFRSTLGRAPRSFRAGRFGIGPRTVPLLESLGYAVESSVTPYVDWGCVSRGLSFVGAPTQPYHPDPTNPARMGKSPLLEVPVTILPRFLAGLPIVGRFVEHRWLRPTRTTGAELVEIAREAIAHTRRSGSEAPVVLNAMLHNVEVVAGMSPYAASEEAARCILDRLSTLLAWTRQEGIRSIGLGDVPGILENS